MSGTLKWVRLDTAFPRNHKIITLLGGKDGHRAAFVYLCGLSYAGEQGTDGFIPKAALGMCHGREVDAERLIDVELWHRVDGGYVVNGWNEYQPTSEETAKRSMNARRNAAKRWGTQ